MKRLTKSQYEAIARRAHAQLKYLSKPGAFGLNANDREQRMIGYRSLLGELAGEFATWDNQFNWSQFALDCGEYYGFEDEAEYKAQLEREAKEHSEITD